ncbi:MAG: MmcQ/YjbR family DNA-binding protein [Cyclobacteriaceae bacterium]
MVSIDTFRKLALSFGEVVEQPHFEKPSFRVNNKIFATLDQKNETVTLKLSEIDQSVFCSFDKSVIYPVSSIWGQQGWTIVELKAVRRDMFKDALTVSYCNVAPKRLSKKYKQQSS